MKKRIILIVLDSAGIGELPDASEYNDAGSNTIGNIYKNINNFCLPNMEKLGLTHIQDCGIKKAMDIIPDGAYGKLAELSKGKDTTTGHWEIAGIITKEAFPTYPNGFNNEIIEKFKADTGLDILCNKAISGTEAIKIYGQEHIQTGKVIVYTSADSVFQIAAHESIIPLDRLYDICIKARKICDKYNILRVIARPFVGDNPNNFKRTSNRRDYSISPKCPNMLTNLNDAGIKVCAIGKISDIYAGTGITQSFHIVSNIDGIQKISNAMQSFDSGLIFANLVDFDMLYGHRNDIAGYADALKEFDNNLPLLINDMQENDILIITADHGCDPSTSSTDHSREYIPIMIYGDSVKSYDLGIRETFADIGATVCDYFNVSPTENGKSFLHKIIK